MDYMDLDVHFMGKAVKLNNSFSSRYIQVLNLVIT